MTNDFALLQAKKNIPLSELNKYLIELDIPHPVQEKMLDQCININLYMFILSDFRNHLALSEIITRNNQTKKITPNSNIISILKNEYIKEDIKNWNKTLFKNKIHLIEEALCNKLNLARESITGIMEVSSLAVIIYFAKLSMQKKMNVSGIIRLLEKEKKIIAQQIPSVCMHEIQLLCIDNRKRTKEYYRGMNSKKDYIAIYYPIIIVCLIIFAYLYYYYNLVHRNINE